MKLIVTDTMSLFNCLLLYMLYLYMIHYFHLLLFLLLLLYSALYSLYPVFFVSFYYAVILWLHYRHILISLFPIILRYFLFLKVFHYFILYLLCYCLLCNTPYICRVSLHTGFEVPLKNGQIPPKNDQLLCEAICLSSL